MHRKENIEQKIYSIYDSILDVTIKQKQVTYHNKLENKSCFNPHIDHDDTLRVISKPNNNFMHVGTSYVMKKIIVLYCYFLN